MDKRILDTPEEVASAFASDLLDWMQGGSMRHIALSGGSTPKILFRLLADKFRVSLPWQDIHLWWGDERCVPPDHEESNFRMTKELLLEQVDIPFSNIHRVRGEDNPASEAKRYGEEIKQFVPIKNGLPQFDLIMLGMGDDGHTASIFPHQMELLKSDAICEIAEHPTSGQKRITLTGPVINHANRIAFLVTGEKKREKVSEIFHATASRIHYPASYIKPESGNLIWYLDKSAAAEI